MGEEDRGARAVYPVKTVTHTHTERAAMPAAPGREAGGASKDNPTTVDLVVLEHHTCTQHLNTHPEVRVKLLSPSLSHTHTVQHVCVCVRV